MKLRKDPTRPVVYICAGCGSQFTAIIAKHLTAPPQFVQWCGKCQREHLFTQKV